MHPGWADTPGTPQKGIAVESDLPVVFEIFCKKGKQPSWNFQIAFV